MITAFKGRGIDPAKRVFAYRNLHSGKWSLRQGGVVVAHADRVLLWGCELKVSEAGRQRVLRERKKNVHAGVEGVVITAPTGVLWERQPKTRKLSYNPYKAPSFTVQECPSADEMAMSSTPWYRDVSVSKAAFVHLDSAGKAWAIGTVD